MSEQHKTPTCTNCSYEFLYANNYCPVCGQKNHELRIPLKHLLEEVLETTLHFDSKTFRTIKLLLLKPGFLSLEFNSGKRANYVPPIRLYVLISFVFFFLLNFLSGGHKNETEHSAQAKAKSGLSISYKGIYSPELSGFTRKQTDSLMRARKIESTNFNKFLVHQMHKLANSSSAEFTHLLMKNISYMMFLLMPVFGAWIYLFNKEMMKYYIESLTVSVHFHSFAFLMFTILLLISSIAGLEIFLLLEFFIMPLYMLIMLRRVLKQSWLLTIGKTVIIGSLYLFSLLVLLILTILISMVFI
jgi:hypothetical protein